MFFLKYNIEVWLIFSVALRSAAQQSDSVYTHKKYLFLFHVLYQWILNIVPYTLQNFVAFPSYFPKSQSSAHHTLPYVNLMSWPSLVLDELSYPLLLRKPLDTYQKWEIKSWARSVYWGESLVRAHADLCMSLTSPGFQRLLLYHL